MSNLSSGEPIRTTERVTASENKSLDVVVSVPAQVTMEPVAPTAEVGDQGTPPTDVSD